MKPFCSILIFVVCVGPTSTGNAQQPVVLEGHANVVSSLAFSPDGNLLVSGSWDRTVRVWNTRFVREVAALSGHRDWVLDVWTSTDGKSILSASQKAIRKWSAVDFSEQNKWSELGGASVNSVAFSQDGKLLAVGRRDGFLHLWTVGDDQPMVRVGGFESWISRLAISPNRKLMAAGTRTGKIRLLALPDGREIARLIAHPNRQILALQFSPDGDTLASGGYQQVAKLWNTKTGKESGKLGGHRGIVTAVAWSNDGQQLATGERHGAIHVWNTSNNKLVRKLAGHSDKRLGFTVTALAFSPDGQRLASGSYDKTIKIWTLTVKTVNVKTVSVKTVNAKTVNVKTVNVNRH